MRKHLGKDFFCSMDRITDAKLVMFLTISAFQDTDPPILYGFAQIESEILFSQLESDTVVHLILHSNSAINPLTAYEVNENFFYFYIEKKHRLRIPFVA